MIDYNHYYLSSNQIETSFRNDIGDCQSGSGTGFWITYQDKPLFVTNKHMVDYLYLRDKEGYDLVELHIWLRTTNSISDCPQKYKITLNEKSIVKHETADVAIIKNIEQTNPNLKVHIQSTPAIVSLADEIFFQNSLKPADNCVFIGYPSNWYDTTSKLPIARLANLASWPGIDFKNKDIKTSHARLVAGLSFGGSSGSPIINKGTELSAGEGLILNGAIAPKIIGIMAGHWWDEVSFPYMFRHTGLSYFVSSLAIYELLKTV